jgi:shikimate dehydrogenase
MPDRYAVVGNPIAHSKSPQIHAAFARATGEDLSYERIEAPLDGFRETIDAFARAGGRGLNVTMPFKEQAFALSTTRSPRAELAKAVNTLARVDDRWHGDNTDGVGLVRDLTHNLDLAIEGRSVLILGAGGASRGVIGPLLALSPARLCVANRTVSRAEALADEFVALGTLEACAPDALADPFDLVVNATPWESGSDVPHWPDVIVGRHTFAYDMVYADEPTAFVRWARARGAAFACDGLGMLVEQAAESFLLWRGVRPETAPVFASLRQR